MRALRSLASSTFSQLRPIHVLIAFALVLLAGVAGAGDGWGPGDMLADTPASAARTAAGDCDQFADARCQEWGWVLEPGHPPVATGSFNCVSNSTGQILD